MIQYKSNANQLPASRIDLAFPNLPAKLSEISARLSIQNQKLAGMRVAIYFPASVVKTRNVNIAI